MSIMHAGTASSRSASWLAILAMVCNTLWPLVANAGVAGATSTIEICTAQGVKKVADDPVGAPGGGSGRHAQSHCSHCCGGTDKVSALIGASLHHAYEPAAYCEPDQAYGLLHPAGDNRSPAYPRAPPALS
jgi:hypothetical protein